MAGGATRVVCGILWVLRIFRLGILLYMQQCVCDAVIDRSKPVELVFTLGFETVFFTLDIFFVFFSVTIYTYRGVLNYELEL